MKEKRSKKKVVGLRSNYQTNPSDDDGDSGDCDLSCLVNLFDDVAQQLQVVVDASGRQLCVAGETRPKRGEMETLGWIKELSYWLC